MWPYPPHCRWCRPPSHRPAPPLGQPGPCWTTRTCLKVRFWRLTKEMVLKGDRDHFFTDGLWPMFSKGKSALFWQKCCQPLLSFEGGDHFCSKVSKCASPKTVKSGKTPPESHLIYAKSGKSHFYLPVFAEVLTKITKKLVKVVLSILSKSGPLPNFLARIPPDFSKIM